MPKKRRSRGRTKGSRGRVGRVQCSGCGALVPRDKVKKVTAFRSIVEPDLSKELKAQGAFIPVQKMTKYYCISCAVFHGVVRIRSRKERKLSMKLSE